MAVPPLAAASFQQADVTTSLGPQFFVDDAAIGGGDATVNQPGQSFDRRLAGLLSPGQGPARVTLTGFGFAASASSSNDATSISVGFTYLGADEALGGGDDVALGSTTATYSHAGAGEYFLAFDSPLSADLMITGTRFRIQITPTNSAGHGSVIFKTALLPFEGVTGAKFSVAGHVGPRRVNLARFQPVTADSTNGQRLASYLTDGLAGNDNRWESDNSPPHWARVDFPHSVEIGGAHVLTGIDDGSAQASFRIQYLSGSSWIDVPGGVVTGNANVESNLVFTSPVSASAFRIQSGDSRLRVRELALFPPAGATPHPVGTDISLNLAHQRPTTASSNSAGNFALLATDGRVHEASKWQTSTSGTQTLEIDLRSATKIGSVHLYSGSSGVAPLANFSMQWWDGGAWQDIPGGVVAGNSEDARRVTFTNPVITSRVRLEFTNPGTTSVRELCIFPANSGNTGYPLGTQITGEPPPVAKFDDFADAFYLLANAVGGVASVVDGVPVVSSPGSPSAGSQYQVLLNLSNGTYRLHNRATGNCLSGDRLSKSPGAALVDAPYSALPDQDWILSRTGASTYRFINAWSGLVIDSLAGSGVPGTPLIQSLPDNTAGQNWQIQPSGFFPKKGIGGTVRAAAFKAAWAYNWGLQNSFTLPAGAHFQPMQWGDFNWNFDTSNPSTWKLYPAWRSTGRPIHLLGFNEPDAFSQSGRSLDITNPSTEAAFSWQRSLDEAVVMWPRLQAMDLPLVSPAPAQNNFSNGWLAGFYSRAAALGYRVDYTGVHHYPGPGGGSSDGLIANLTSAYGTWNRPVWLTEFSFVDWNRTSSWSEEDNYNALAEFLWRAEGLPWLRKYALFVFTADADHPQPPNPWQATTPAPRSNSYDEAGNLTAFGRLYAAWDGDTTVRPDKRYFIHHKESRKRLASIAGQGGAAARNIRNDSTVTEWTLVPAGTANRYHLVSASDGRRLSFTNGGAVVLDPPGTTGSAVEWTLTESQHGWFHIGHPATSRRLRMAYNNSNFTATFTMEPASNATDSVQWRFIVPMPAPEWVGVSSGDWMEGTNWMPGEAPSGGKPVAFHGSAVANLSTTLNQAFSLAGITLTRPAGNVAIGGTHTLTLGESGIDLSAAVRDLSIAAPIGLSAAQTWNVAPGRHLGIGAGVAGSFPLQISGGGTVSLGAAVDPLLPLTVAAGATLRTSSNPVFTATAGSPNPVIHGTLDLNGTSQSFKDADGGGSILNTAPSPATLTVGLHASSTVTLDPLLRDGNGPLALVKTGSSDLILPAANANAFSGGFTNHGSGRVFPRRGDSFGSGPVVMNGSTIYCTDGSHTFGNPLALNDAILRIGGGVGRTLTWSGPVAASGTAAGISADGSTSGVILAGALDIGGATFTASASGSTVNQIQGGVSGANGHLTASGGTLQLSAVNDYGGSTIITNAATLRVTASGALPAAGNVIIHSGGILNIRSTAGWVHSGPITGDGSGSIQLNSGTDATLAGTVSGVASILVNQPGTNVTLAGPISGSATVQVQSAVDTGGSGAILRLGGANTYSGGTVIQRGTLVLAASNVLPDHSPVSLGHSTGGARLEAGNFTDTAGTLDVLDGCTMHLAPGSALSFANSSAVSWAGGSLNLTGGFVSGASLRFGTGPDGLTPTQLGLIRVNGGGGPFALDGSGFLVDTSVTSFASWRLANGTSGGFEDDHDGDGVANGIEYFLFGKSPTTGFTGLPGVEDQSVTWNRSAGYPGIYGIDFVVETSPSMAPGSWAQAPLGSGPDMVALNGSEVRFHFSSGARKFVRLRVWGP